LERPKEFRLFMGGAAMEKAERQEAKVVKRKPAARRKREQVNPVSHDGDREDVVVLKQRITRLEAENKQLRKQIAELSDTMSRPSQPRSDSVREQQHNFFKYSNVRRY
jgi:cell division protein FtsB